MNKFFLICPIGLEKLLEIELIQKWEIFFTKIPLPERLILTGGVEIICTKEVGFSLNHILRTPSKVLWRIKTRKCRDLPRFYNIIKKIPWKDYLNSEELDLSITAKKSRLIHTGRLQESFQKALKDYFSANAIKEKRKEKHKDNPLQKVFIRFFEDEVTISLDTSGDLLHIRGDRSFRGHASIRENIASLLLIKLMHKLPPDNYHLVDPMCGTGTFLFEWRKRLDLNKRKFLYEYLPEKILIDIPNLTEPKKADFFTYQGFDIDSEVIEKNNELKSDISFSTKDLFKDTPVNELKNIVIINPPYGKRVKIKGDKVTFFKDLIKQIEITYKPLRLGIIIPRDFVSNLKGERLYFKQNGIDVCFLTRKY